MEKRTDVERSAHLDQFKPTWEARSISAADLIPAGSRVLDIGCGAMSLEGHLPFGCAYVPCDVVQRDPRTIVVDINEDEVPQRAVSDVDWVVMLGVLERLDKPGEALATLGRLGKPIICSYCTRETTSHLDRRSFGWVNDFSLEEFIGLARQNGYSVALHKKIDELQYLFKLTKEPDLAPRQTRRVHVISYNNIGNFGDRLGYHLINDILPSHVEVSWGTLRPFSEVPPNVDMLIIGIGNSLFGNLIDDALLQAIRKSKLSIGIFGTQYRETLPTGRLKELLNGLTHWYARYEEDIFIYGGSGKNISHLGDWLINAFPLANGVDEKVLYLGKEMWEELPLDRTIQRIQRHCNVVSTRLHPLLCALTSAVSVAYVEQREMKNHSGVSGKFRSMLIDVFGQTYPEKTIWRVDREKVAAYKTKVRKNTDEMRRHIERLLA